MTQLNVSPTHYDLVYKILHWVMAVLVLMMFLAGMGFESAQTEADKLTMLTGHSSLGTIIAILIFVRILKRFVKKDPVPEHDLPSLQKKLARTVQYLLYVLLILIPITGFLTARLHELPVNAFASFNYNAGLLFDEQAFLNMRLIHEICIKSLMFLLAAHIGAALMHGFVKKDAVLKSMSLFRRSVKN